MALRIMPKDVSSDGFTELSIGAQKLGQPVRLSNFVFDEKFGKLQPTQENTPDRASCSSGLEKGRSVPASRSTEY